MLLFYIDILSSVLEILGIRNRNVP